MNKILRIPEFIIDGAIEDTDASTMHFLLEPYNWHRRPLIQAQKPNLPICWTRDQAYWLYSNIYPDVETFALFEEGNVLADPFVFMKNTIIKKPKAICMANVTTAFGNMAPEQEKIEEMREELVANGIFATKMKTSLSVANHTLLRMGLLHKDTLNILEPTVFTNFDVLDIDPLQSIGGEVLFIFSDIGHSSFSITPYYFQGEGPLPLVRAHDKEIFDVMIPRFEKFKILYLIGTANQITAPAVAALDTFVADLPEGSVEVKRYNDLIYRVGGIDQPGFAPAKADVETTIRDFFQLP